MYQNERWNEILRQLKKYGFVTVKYLVETLHYSNATINRDLNALEGQGLVKRSYGGVELSAEANSATPLPFRYHKMRSEKLKIGKAAADLIKDFDVVFIDGSTTSESMAEFIAEKKSVTVVTNNMALVSFLSELGVKAFCLGGYVKEAPSMLGGAQTVENAAQYHYDKMFFSSGYFSEEGEIGSSETYYLLHKTAAAHADEVYYLADHSKTIRPKHSWRILFDFSRVSGVISDYHFSEAVKAKYPKTTFIKP